MFSIFKIFSWLMESDVARFQECMRKIVQMEPHVFTDETIVSFEVDIREEPNLAFEFICDRIVTCDLKISHQMYDLICECRKYYLGEAGLVELPDESYVTDGPTTTEPDE